MIGDKLVMTIVVVDSGDCWSATGRWDIDTPTKRIDVEALRCAEWWAIEAVQETIEALSGDEGGERREHTHRTHQPKSSRGASRGRSRT